MFGHFSDVLPILIQGKAHHGKDSVQLVMVIGVTRLDVFLPAVEDGLRGQKFGKNATDGPYV